MDALPRVLIHARDASEYRQWLEARGCPAELAVSTTAAEAEARVGDAEVLFCWRFPAALLPRAVRLRWIQSMGAGVDDLVLSPHLPPGVDVTRVVGPFGAAMSEYVFAALLARARRLHELRDQQARREWRPLPSDTLEGRTIGIAGLGFVGREVARRARAFGMRVLGLSRTTRRADFVDRHFGSHEWPAFVRELDYLVLALPLTNETRHVVDSRVLGAMKPDAVIVNVGRGALVREEDLVRALKEGRVGGAVLDVFEEEPLPPENPLWTMENVIVTPHVSGPSRVDQVGAFFLDNLRRYLRGEALVGLVDRERSY